MKNDFFRWQRLFLFCLGLFIAKEKIVEIFSGIDDKVKTILGYHLSFDFIFMAGCYPGIVCLCMLASKKTSRKSIKSILFTLAFLQIFGWTFDVVENYYLLKWLKDPVIGDEFGFYHLVV